MEKVENEISTVVTNCAVLLGVIHNKSYNYELVEVENNTESAEAQDGNDNNDDNDDDQELLFTP